jgi:hypothetical protein
MDDSPPKSDSKSRKIFTYAPASKTCVSLIADLERMERQKKKKSRRKKKEKRKRIWTLAE